MILPITDVRWMNFIEQTPNANIFHHPAWSHLLAQCYNYSPKVFTFVDSQNAVTAGLPLMQLPNLISGVRWECLPFTDHCFPLYQDETDQSRLYDAILASAREKNINGVGFRGEPISHMGVRQTRQYAWQTLQLEDDFRYVSDRIHPMHKRNARTAEKRGVRIKWGNTKEDIDTFYRLHLQERHRQGVPVQPKRFFHLIEKLLLQTGLGSILFAYKDEKVISGLLLLHFGQILTYKFGASDKASLIFRPNDLLFWTAIQWGCENHLHLFDLGRSDLDNRGLISYKQGWGADELPLSYFSSSSTLHQRVTGKMSGMMKTVIRNSPPWVCRFIGELFYKYAG